MTQIVASGGEVDILNFIGNHECSKTSPSLFNEDGTMRAAGTNSSLVKVLREETGVMPPSHRRRGATTVFGQNRHHRSDTASSFS